MNSVFRTTLKIKFRDADPAQIMYFGNLTNFAHDAFEEFIAEAGYTFREWFSKDRLMIPIRHTEVDYLAPFLPGETYDVLVTVSQIRETSFQMKYIFQKNGKAHGVVKMVHAILDSTSMQKTAVPTLMRERLQPYLETP